MLCDHVELPIDSRSLQCLSTAVPILCRAAVHVRDILMRIPQHDSNIHLPHRFTAAVSYRTLALIYSSNVVILICLICNSLLIIE